MRALVTGASEGIGRAIARELAERGFDLVIAARHDDLLDAADALRGPGAEVTPVQVDLATAAGVDELVDALAGQPLDVAALNAGTAAGGAFGTGTALEDQLAVVDLNVRGTVQLAHHVTAAMVARGEGRILFTSSIAANMPGPFDAVYNASKSFVQSFALALRNELQGHGRDGHFSLMPGPSDTVAVREGRHGRHGARRRRAEGRPRRRGRTRGRRGAARRTGERATASSLRTQLEAVAEPVRAGRRQGRVPSAAWREPGSAPPVSGRRRGARDRQRTPTGSPPPSRWPRPAESVTVLEAGATAGAAPSRRRRSRSPASITTRSPPSTRPRRRRRCSRAGRSSAHGLRWIHPRRCYAHPLPGRPRGGALRATSDETAASLDGARARGRDGVGATFAAPYLRALRRLAPDDDGRVPARRGARRGCSAGAQARAAPWTGRACCSPPPTRSPPELFTASGSRAWLYGSAMHGDVPAAGRGERDRRRASQPDGPRGRLAEPRGRGVRARRRARLRTSRSLGGRRADRRGASPRSGSERGRVDRRRGGRRGTPCRPASSVADVTAHALLALAGDALAATLRGPRCAATATAPRRSRSTGRSTGRSPGRRRRRARGGDGACRRRGPTTCWPRSRRPAAGSPSARVPARRPAVRRRPDPGAGRQAHRVGVHARPARGQLGAPDRRAR